MRAHRARFYLLGDRRLLQEHADGAVLAAAIDAVVPCDFGADQCPQASYPAVRELDRPGIEVQEDISGGDDDLPTARRRPGQSQVERDEPVEKCRPERAAGISRDGDEDLAAGAVGRQAL